MANYRIVSICLIMKCCGKKSGEKKRVDQDQIVDLNLSLQIRLKRKADLKELELRYSN